MNDSELNRILKAAKVPQRPPDFREQFPRRVTSRLHWKTAGRARMTQRWFPRFSWALAGLAACLVAGFLIGHGQGKSGVMAENDLLQNEKVLQEMFAMFPNRVRAIVQDQRGINLVLSDKDDVPASAPLWVKVCDGKNCSAVVTFSGQAIEVGQRQVTVMADASGKIILAGDNFLWSNGKALLADNHLKIEAKTLAPVVL